MKMNKEQFEEDIIPILVLTIVVCIAVITLSIINSITEGPIEDAEKEKIKELLEEQFPDLATYEEDTPSKDVYTVKNESGAILGYAFNIVASGYGGDIKILVAIENTSLSEDDIILRGISIISNTETPGLGAKITEESWLEQFSGANMNEVFLKADGGNIDAISGATISSSAVVDAIQKEAGAKVKSILDEREGGV
jgi:Na+-translocating ferredoxin:NAD+ oxidoreductase subunit G